MIRPLGERVLVKRCEAEEKTEGGLIIPTQAAEKPQLADVVAVGEEVKGVKKGDRVLLKKYGGNEFKYKDEEFIILDAEDLLAVIDNK